MIVTHSLKKEIVVLNLVGQFISGNAVDSFRLELARLIRSGRKSFLLNMAQVNHIDSSGIGALVSSLTTVKNNQGQLKLLSLSPRVRGQLMITKLQAVFEIFDDEKTAVESFKPQLQRR